jgi:N utilization substance protein B
VTRPRQASRRRGREAALQVLYAIDLAARGRSRTGPPSEVDVVSAFEGVALHFELPAGARAFAKDLVLGVMKHRDELDAVLSAHAAHWRLSRMAAVDRNILRLGAHEILNTGTPPAEANDEAVELAHRYGNHASPAFVNGVLDAVARGRAGGEGR